MELVRSFIRIMTLTLIIVGCATIYPMISSTDEELIPYIDKFHSIHGGKTVRAELGLVKGVFGDSTVGICWQTIGYIKIDKNWRKKASERRKTMLMFHELGHCAKGWDHDNELRSDRCPKSLMYKYIPDDICIHRYFDEYIKNER